MFVAIGNKGATTRKCAFHLILQSAISLTFV